MYNYLMFHGENMGGIGMAMDKAVEANRKSRFEAYIGKEFETFPRGDYDTDLPDVDSLNIIRPVPDKDGKINQLSIIVVYQNHDRRATFTLTRGGELIGRMPKELNFTKDELHDEILNIAESISPDFFESVDDEILPEGDWLTAAGEGREDRIHRKSEPGTDKRRVAFVRKQAMFGMMGINSGFRGYYGFFFRNGLILENDKIKNAMYMFKFDHPIENSPPLNAPVETRRRFRRHAISTYWNPIKELSKSQSLEAGGIQVVHLPHDDEDWETRMRETIEVIR